MGDWKKRKLPTPDARCAAEEGGRAQDRPPALSRITHHPSPITNAGFSLIELLVALAVFAALAAAAYGGLAQLARTRAALATQQDRLAALTRAVAALERDLRQATSRSVLGNGRSELPLPAVAGTANAIELTRLGYANPRAEPRSHLERVAYALDAGHLRRGRYAVLDRAPDSVPATTALLDRVDELRLRYLGCDGAWREAWPPSTSLDSCALGIKPESKPKPSELLPRAIEFRLTLTDYGEIRRVVELPSSSPPQAPQ